MLINLKMKGLFFTFAKWKVYKYIPSTLLISRDIQETKLIIVSNTIDAYD